MTALLAPVSEREPRDRPVTPSDRNPLDAFRVAYEHRRAEPAEMLTKSLRAWCGRSAAGAIEWHASDEPRPVADARHGSPAEPDAPDDAIVVTVSPSDRLSAWCDHEDRASFTSFVRFLAAIVRDEHVVPRDHRRALEARLSAMQRRITPLLVKGMSEREIGRELARSHHTIHEHVKAIYAALRVRSRIELRDLWLGRSQDTPIE